MFVYEKKLQYPVKITSPNPALAKLILTQYGGAYFKFRYDKLKVPLIKKAGTSYTGTPPLFFLF